MSKFFLFVLCVTLLVSPACQRGGGDKHEVDNEGNPIPDTDEPGRRLGDKMLNKMVQGALAQFEEKYGAVDPIEPARVGFHSIVNRTAEPMQSLDFTTEQVWNEVISPAVFARVAPEIIIQGMKECGFSDVKELIVPEKMRKFRDVMYRGMGQALDLLIFGYLDSRETMESRDGITRTSYSLTLRIVNLKTLLEEPSIFYKIMTEYQR